MDSWILQHLVWWCGPGVVWAWCGVDLVCCAPGVVCTWWRVAAWEVIIKVNSIHTHTQRENKRNQLRKSIERYIMYLYLYKNLSSILTNFMPAKRRFEQYQSLSNPEFLRRF